MRVWFGGALGLRELMVAAGLERSIARYRRSASRLFRGYECSKPLRFVGLEAEEAQTAGKVITRVLLERIHDPGSDALALSIDVIEAELDLLPGFERGSRLDAGAADGELIDDDWLAVATRQFDFGRFGDGDARPAARIPIGRPAHK